MDTLKKLIIGTFILNLLFACGSEEFSTDTEFFNENYEQQAERTKIDIVVVVDNSTSMFNDQQNFSREFENFISSIEEADYRIGVITTDVHSEGKENTPGFYGNLDEIGDGGALYISPESSDPDRLFREAIQREETALCHSQGNGLCVSPHEKPINALKLALEKRSTVNSGFFRNDAELAVIIITDEDETSYPTASDIVRSGDFLRYFDDQFSGSKLLQVFSITILEGDTQCLSQQIGETQTGSAVYGIEVSKLSNLTGGFNVSICSENYGTEIQKISELVEKKLLITRIRVGLPPIESSIKLKVTKDGRVLDIKWRLVPGFIELFPAPPEGSTINLSFRF